MVELERVATGVVVIDNPRLARTPIFSWRLDDDVDWFVSYGHTGELLDRLAEHGFDEVTLLADPERETLEIAPYTSGTAVESPILEARGIPVVVIRVPARSGPRSGGGASLRVLPFTWRDGPRGSHE